MAEINEFLSKQAKQEVEQYIKNLEVIVKNFDSISKSVDRLDKEQKQENRTQKQLTTRQKEALKLQKQLRSAKAKNEQATSNLNKALIKQKEALKQTNKEIREQAKASLGIKKTNGLFRSMTKSILAASSAMLGLTAVFKVLKDAGKLVREFQKENAVLAGVLGKTRDEIDELTKDAERLGATTAKTAKEVTALQIAYARLGFTQEEILNLTEDTIDGSIALNAELDETAELTGAMIRSFEELSTTDADDALDQLTLSTQRTALNFQKLQTALPIVAGAASAAGVSFSRVVAQLGQAADRGIDASTAATSLRNVYIELAAKGLTLDQALSKINMSQDKLSTATKLFGKRAAVTALALADNIEKTNDLDKALQNAGGTAKSVADEQLATLDGSIKLLTSAWQGFILSIENGDGVIADFVNGTLKTFANALTELSNLDLIFTRTSKLTSDQIARTYDALNSLSNTQGRRFQKFVDEYDDVSSQWLAINKDTAIQLLNDLKFSNQEAELLYTEHLRRLVEQEKTAAIAAEEERLRLEKKKQEELERIREFERMKAANHLDFINNIEANNVESTEKYTNEKLTINQKYLDDILDREKKAKQTLIDWESEYNDEKKKLIDNYQAYAISAINNIYNAQLNSIDNQLENLDAYYQTRIQAQSNLGENTIQLETEYNLKRQQLEEERTKKEKQQALINIGISTAQGAFDITKNALTLTSAAALNPLLAPLIPFAWAQLGLLGISSGAQIAAVTALDSGSESTPSTYLAGEKRPEFRKHNGQWELLTKPTLFTDSAGDTIIGGAETEQILKGAGMKATTGNAQLDTERIVRAIENNSPSMGIDKRGIITITKKNKSVTTWLNTNVRN